MDDEVGAPPLKETTHVHVQKVGGLLNKKRKWRHFLVPNVTCRKQFYIAASGFLLRREFIIYLSVTW